MFQAFFARQLARPSGLFGRWVMGSLLDRENRAMNELTLEHLAPKAGDRVLEVGFGGGALLHQLLQSPCASVAGLDLSGEMVALARKRFHAGVAAGRLDLRQGSIDALPYRDGAFTCVCTVNTLYFWPDVARALAECRRVLEPGGRLVQCFNAREDLERWPGHRHGFRLYDVTEVEARLRAAGFSSVSVAQGADPRQGSFYCVRAG